MITPLPSAGGRIGKTPAAPASCPVSRFGQFLSELNPLQYLPVVGTIYRAITGDVIPQEARFAGSLVVSGLTSGLLGVAINLAISGLEKITGIDPEAIGSRVLAELGIGSSARSAQPALPTALAPAPAKLLPKVEEFWPAVQAAAYRPVPGVSQAISESDALNGLELVRLARGGFLAITA